MFAIVYFNGFHNASRIMFFKTKQEARKAYEELKEDGFGSKGMYIEKIEVGKQITIWSSGNVDNEKFDT